jgi:CHAD domain-containing protein
MMSRLITDSSMLSADQLLLDALEKNWRQYLVELKRCKREFSNEAVHDLRTATRRVMTVIQLQNSITPRPRLEKIIRAFENQLGELDDLRDTQVILAAISETIHELPGLQGFQIHQQAVEKKILRTLRRRIKKINIEELSKRVRKAHHSLQTEVESNLEPQLLQAVDDAYLITKLRLAWVDPARSATIHRVGIAFKVFRYRVEIAHPLLKEFPRENLDSMHHYQSLMSEIRDTEIFMETLAEFSEQSSYLGIESIRTAFDCRHTDAIAAYAREMEHLYLFWRPAPDQPFPWNQTE